MKSLIIVFKQSNITLRYLAVNFTFVSPYHKIRINTAIILPVVLYGCETLSLTLKEEHKLRVFVNRVLRKVFGLKWYQVTGGRRKLHNEELHDLYASPSIITIIKSRRMRWAGHVA
jgi:hypothetical protein